MGCDDEFMELDDVQDQTFLPIADLLLREACTKVIDGGLLCNIQIINSELSKKRFMLSGMQVLWLICHAF